MMRTAISPQLATSSLIIGRPPPAGLGPHLPAKPLQDYPAWGCAGPPELDDDERGGAAGAPVSGQPLVRCSTHCRRGGGFLARPTRTISLPSGTRSRCSARAPGASARAGLAAARRLPRCAAVWTSA